MMHVWSYTLISFLLTIIISSFNLITYKTTYNKEKNSAFECGFDPTGSPRLPFCMKFFLVGVIFLIFDVEVALLLPLPFSQPYIIMLLMVLMIGLLYEWYYGGLEWLI